MKITVKQTTEKEIEVITPIFFRSKHGDEYLAALDENNVIEIINRPNYKCLQNCELWLKERSIADALKDFDVITEHEFLIAHESFIQSLSLNPVLHVDQLPAVASE